jgi:hypothetical protein
MGTTTKRVIFWVITLCISETSQRFRDTYRLHLHGLRVIKQDTSSDLSHKWSRKHAENTASTNTCIVTRVLLWFSHDRYSSVHWWAGCCLTKAVVSRSLPSNRYISHNMFVFRFSCSSVLPFLLALLHLPFFFPFNAVFCTIVGSCYHGIRNYRSVGSELSPLLTATNTRERWSLLKVWARDAHNKKE